MSSDSGESGGSVEHEDSGKVDAGNGGLGADMEPQNTQEPEILTKEVLEEERDKAREELNSGINGTSFVRRNAAQAHEVEEESTSELSIRQLERGLASPDSASIPDDTPSIQVGPEEHL